MFEYFGVKIDRKLRTVRGIVKLLKIRTMAKGDLLNIDNNPKTRKGTKRAVRTAIMYLAASDMSGWNVCQYASAGCRAACLVFAGMAAAYVSINQARIKRTRRFFKERAAYMARLVFETERHIIESVAHSMIPAVRLNGTSDLPWERIPCDRGGVQYASIFEAFAMDPVTFYDYTKAPASKRQNLPGNYSLTFSLAEDNRADAIDWLAAGGNVAVVFDVKTFPGRTLPATFWGYRVIDADGDDARFLDPENVIVGLKAKGLAKTDDSGFVVTHAIYTYLNAKYAAALAVAA